MKFAAIIEYGPDKEKVKAHHPAHRAHLRRFLENGAGARGWPICPRCGSFVDSRRRDR